MKHQETEMKRGKTDWNKRQCQCMNKAAVAKNEACLFLQLFPGKNSKKSQIIVKFELAAKQHLVSQQWKNRLNGD